tara:strand:+ start:659 stop:853 length:195 start_codon:yes stop_codon:yes gene_type:complete
MDVQITRHGVPEEEFRQLKNLFYLGKYDKSDKGFTTEWFNVVIDMRSGEHNQKVELTWFLEWKK